jgi:hypothetical protein
MVMDPGSVVAKARAPAGAGQAALAALALVLAAGPLAALPGAGNAVHLRLERIEHPQLSASGIDLRLAPGADGAAPAELSLTADSLQLPQFGQRLQEVRFQCQPEPLAAEGDAAAADPAGPAKPAPAPAAARQWRCRGPLRWRGGGGDWQLAWQGDEALARVELSLEQGRSRVRLQLPLGEQPLAVNAQRVRAAWLRALLPQVAWGEGSVDASLALQAEPGRWRGTVRTRGLGGRAADGALEFAGLDLAGPVEVAQPAGGGLDLTLDPVLAAGELLAGTIYLEWPAGSQVALQVQASQRGAGWRIERFALRDGGFELDAQAQLKPAQADWLQQLQATASFDLREHYGRYLEGAMASLGLPGLEAAGGLELALQLGPGAAVAALDARFDEVDLADPGARFRIAGLHGALGFRAGDQAPAPTSLRWRELGLHTLRFDPGALEATSAGGELRASGPLRLGLFGGELALDQLVYRPLVASGDMIEASLTLAGIDIAAMVTAFGWPAFTGQLEGRLPQLRYGDGRLAADGEIDIRAFDGAIAVAGLAIERPFGVAPALSAQVRLDNLDLVPITQVFGFGRIEGRLDGSVDGLRLLDWRPVAFDARLATRASGRRRISQLAVEQLTRIGGAGSASGLQGRLLGAFDSFGYRRIGLSCTLANDVCTMGGVDEAAGGYTILQGSGLPLITIRGFQRQVDWPVLVSRLQAALAGQAPVVR